MTEIHVDIPTLETEDLILRGYCEADFEAVAAFGASDRARFVGGPHTRWDSWRAFLAAIGHWALRGYGMWMVEHRKSATPAGRVGMIYNDCWHEPELGWHIFEGFEGRGLAYQACVAARDYAARHQGLNSVISYVAPDNARSVALAHRLGCTLERDVTLLGKPCQIWRHPKIEEATA